MSAESPSQNSGVVLLAEDSEDDILIFQRAYDRAGVTNPLRIVRGGHEAIAYLQGNGNFSDRSEYPFPTLMLLDLKMPDKSGLEVLQWMRSRSNTNELPVVILTNAADLKTVNRAYELGANAFLLKSLDMTDFVEELQEVRNYWL